MNDVQKRERLKAVIQALIEFHLELTNVARVEYELAKGGRLSSGAFLQALLAEPSLQWLRPLSQLIIELDTRLDEGPLDDASIVSAAENVTALVAPSDANAFTERCEAMLQMHPGIALLHGNLLVAVAKLRQI